MADLRAGHLGGIAPIYFAGLWQIGALLDTLKPSQAGEHSDRPGTHLDGNLLSYSGMVILFAGLFLTVPHGIHSAQ
jgi:hypothetical protein